VNSALQATIPLLIQDGGGGVQPFDSLVDTGYDGFLALQPARIAALGLPYLRRLLASLADGSTIFVDVHLATIVWDGVQRTVEVDAVDGAPLVGMKLLEGCELRIKVVSGGLVTIETPP